MIVHIYKWLKETVFTHRSQSDLRKARELALPADDARDPERVEEEHRLRAGHLPDVLYRDGKRVVAAAAAGAGAGAGAGAAGAGAAAAAAAAAGGGAAAVVSSSRGSSCIAVRRDAQVAVLERRV